jgi:glycosyltransferase involved in cell wall biosynthesis
MLNATAKNKMNNSDNSGNTTLNSDIWCVIPTFNNKSTIKEVALGCRKYLEHILVVDDGSYDADIQALFSGTDIIVLKHPKNLGKGQAIRTALDFIQKQDGKFMLTIDADGQHYPQDIEKFIRLLKDDSGSIIIGCRDFTQKNVPGKSQFGRAFSNFWLRLETGVVISDTQSGFRCYPVKYLSQIKTSGNYYDFETEILIRACWSGIKLTEVPINVFYPEPGLRVSSFHPFIDNLRISLMHIRLLGRRLLPFPYPKVVRLEKTKIPINIFIHPIKLIKTLLKENASPLGLGVSAGVGVFLGVLPLVSVHILAVLYVTSRLHLNKIMALSVQNLCMPPFVPVACIELGHFMLYRKWLTVISWQAVFGEIPERIWEWFLGSLILAPIMALITVIIIYFTAQAIQRKMINHAKIY